MTSAPSCATMSELFVGEPTDEELTAQLPDELESSRRHLHTILDGYWDPAWRRSHKGPDQSPEDHLWRAASAVPDVLDTLDRQRDPATCVWDIAHRGEAPLDVKRLVGRGWV